MPQKARIVFGGAHYPINPDSIDDIVAKLNDVKLGGSSVLTVNVDGETDTLFWTHGAPIAFEVWEESD